MRAALPDAALDVLFREARSYNGYTDEPVSEDTLRALYDLVKMGPTSANQSPARFVWCPTSMKSRLRTMRVSARRSRFRGEREGREARDKKASGDVAN